MSNAQPATITELQAACQGASPDFLLSQIRAGATVRDAVSNFCTALRSELSAANQQAQALQYERDQLQQQLAQLRAPSGQHRAIPQRGLGSETSGGSAAATVKALVDAHVEDGMPRPQAHSRVMKEYPELRERLVREANC